MLQTLKDYAEEFSLLPNALKMFIAAAIFITLFFGIYSGARNYVSNLKIEKLEKQNFDLNRQAQNALEKAAVSDKQAADERLRADSIEEKLKSLDPAILKKDEQIQTQSQKSNSLRDSLRVVRNSSPANASTNDLERRLKERYRQSEPR